MIAINKKEDKNEKLRNNKKKMGTKNNKIIITIN